MSYDHRQFRSTIKRDVENRRKQRSKGRGVYSYFKMPKSPTTIRLFPGEYNAFDGSVRPYFVKFTHYDVRDGRVRDCQGTQCLMCWHRDNADTSNGKKDRFSYPSQKSVFTIAHMTNYHLVEQTSDKGEAYKKKVECEGRRCAQCKEGVEKVFGKKLHWTMKADDLAILQSYDKEMAKKCQCGEGDIFVLSYECGKCLTEVLDAQNSNLDEDELLDFGDQPKRCSKCGHTGLPEPILECATEAGDSEWTKCCDDPRPVNIFTTNLDIKGVEKMRGDGKAFTSLQITAHEPVEMDERVKDITPYDFDSMFDMSLQKQSDLLGLDVPDGFESRAPSQASTVEYE